MNSNLVRLFLSSFILAASPLYASDSITIGTNSHNGVFQQFKNNRFYFQPEKDKTVSIMQAAVVSLVLDPPANVSVKPFGRKTIDKIKFKAYTDKKFIFEEEGKEIVITKVSSIEMGLDFSRSMQLTKEADKEEPADIDLEKAVTPGAVTVVHFHLPDLMPSVRQGNYIEKKATESKGKIRFIRISFTSWEDPKMKKYNVETLPQFWIYDRKGKLYKKLIERFTAEDLDSAVLEAGK